MILSLNAIDCTNVNQVKGFTELQKAINPASIKLRESKMNQTGKLKKYAELFESRLKQYLANGISIHTKIYPSTGEGAVYEFTLDGENKGRVVVMPPRQSVGEILASIPQKMIGGDMRNVRFKGTNLSLENNRILVIKGEDDRDQWSGNAASEDVDRVISGALSSSSR